MDEYPVSGERWIEAELDYLRAHYCGNSIELSAAMGRTPKAITAMAQKLGLQKARVPLPPKRPMAEIRKHQEERAELYIAARKNGMSWGQVADKFGLPKGAVIGTVWRYRKRCEQRVTK